MDVIWYSDQWIKEYNLEMPPERKFRIPERKYFTIEFTGDEKENQVKIERLKVLVNQMNSNKDTLNAYKVKFTHNSYATMVMVLDLCKLSDRNYGFFSIPIKDNVYMLYRKMNRNSYFRPGQLFICGSINQRVYPPYKTGLTVMQEQLFGLQKLICTIWPALIFLVLMILPEKIKLNLLKRRQS